MNFARSVRTSVHAWLAGLQTSLNRFHPLKRWGVLGLFFSYGAFMLVGAVRQGAPVQIALGLALAGVPVILVVLRRQLTVFEVHLAAPNAALGGTIEVTIAITPRQDLEVERMVARLIEHEEAANFDRDRLDEKRGGWALTHSEQPWSEATVLENTALLAGQPMNYRCRLEVPKTGTSRVSRPGVAVFEYSWRVQVEATTPGGTTHSRETPVTVHPRGRVPMAPKAAARRLHPYWLVVGVLAGGMFCTKGVIEVSHLADEGTRLENLQKKTEMSPFSPSGDGAVAETRLLQFLEVRQRVFRSYDPHKAEIEATFLAMEKVKSPDHGVADVFKGFSLALWHFRVNTAVHTAQVEGQAAAAMNDAEYRYLIQQVYGAKAAVNAELLRKHELAIATYAMNGRSF
jgi:hypothetical protein